MITEQVTSKTFTEDEIKRLILAEVPRFIKTDSEIREFILRIASERFADNDKTEDRFERFFEELKRDREENQRKWEENQKIIMSMLNDINIEQEV